MKVFPLLVLVGLLISAAGFLSGCGRGGSMVTASGCNKALCRRCVADCIMNEDKSFDDCGAICYEKQICDTPKGKCA